MKKEIDLVIAAFAKKWPGVLDLTDTSGVTVENLSVTTSGDGTELKQGDVLLNGTVVGPAQTWLPCDDFTAALSSAEVVDESNMTPSSVGMGLYLDVNGGLVLSMGYYQEADTAISVIQSLFEELIGVKLDTDLVIDTDINNNVGIGITSYSSNYLKVDSLTVIFGVGSDTVEFVPLPAADLGVLVIE